MKKLASLLMLLALAGCTAETSSPSGNETSNDNTPIQTSDLADFATCLGSRAVLYYSHTCPHCHDQMNMFGDTVDQLTKHDCLEERDLCSGKNITGVPAWIFEDNSTLLGKQSFETLANQSGCILPDSLRTPAL